MTNTTNTSIHTVSQSVVAGSDTRLIENFVRAITNFTTLETAKHSAKQAEIANSRSMASIRAQNNLYVTPEDMTSDQREQLAYSSFDAHLQMLQSTQLASKISQDMAQLDAATNSLYLGQKATFQIIDPAFDPIESYWFDPATGQYSQGSITAKQVKGTIHEISLYKNLIILRPSLYSRLVFPKRKFYFVYVINPKTLMPAVRLLT